MFTSQHLQIEQQNAKAKPKQNNNMNINQDPKTVVVVGCARIEKGEMK